MGRSIRMATRVTSAWLLGLVLAAALPAFAQSTGGSFGSSGFGGSSSSSSSSSSWGSSSSSGEHSPPAPRSAADMTPPEAELGQSYLPPRNVEVPAAESAIASPGANILVGFAACALSFAILFGVLGTVGWIVAKPKPGGAKSSGGTGFDLRRVSIAFDWNARAEIQAALDTMSRTVPMGSDEGRRQALVRAAQLLADRARYARYACHQSLPKSESTAEQAFLAMASDLRSRYRHETRGQRAHDAAPELRARADEGRGLVVVSIVVCARGRMPPLPGRIDRDAVSTVLHGLIGSHAIRVVALEIVWSPAEDNDRLSSAELENLYPELLRVDAGTDVGRIQCGYCSAVFPAEIGRCPGCGAATPPSPPAGAAGAIGAGVARS